MNLVNKYSEIKAVILNSVLEDNIKNKFEELGKDFEVEIKKWLNDNQKDTGSFLWPLRVCLSGKTKSPSPFELMTVLQINDIKDRIEKCLE